MDKPMISIVVPVYNSKVYLKQCLDSIIAQTYRNLEVLLIDDGSTDGSGEICDQYAAQDKRIRVFYNTNHGVSYSRNCGIQAAHGKYVLFIDSDDMVNDGYVEALMEHADQYDLCVASLKDVWTKKNRVRIRKWPRGITNSFQKDYHWACGTMGYGPWAKLFSMDILQSKKIFFPEDVQWGEDRLFLSEYFKSIKTYFYAWGRIHLFPTR